MSITVEIPAELVERVNALLARAAARKNRERYGDKRDQAIAELYRAGEPTIRIAERFATSPGAILRVVRRQGVKIRPANGPRPASERAIKAFAALDAGAFK